MPARVSVIITSYNYGRFLRRTIESVRSQDVDGLEIVVVDNHSTDDSWEIAQSFASRDERIRAYRNEQNIGMVPNHNRGLELATGNRITFLSADDYLLPGHLARVLALHDQHPDIDLVYTSYVKVDENERFVQQFGHRGHLRGEYAGNRNEFADLLTDDCYMCLPTTLLERQPLLESGGLDDGLIAGDLELYLRMAAMGKRFAFLDVPGVAIRLHANEISGEERYVATGRQLLDHLYLLDRFIQPENAALIKGREHGIHRLLAAKVNNLRPYPDVAAQLLAEQQPRIDSSVQRLHAIAKTAAAPPTPFISVIFQATEPTQALDSIAMLDRQQYENFEVIVAADSSPDFVPLLLDRAQALDVSIVRHHAAQRQAVALNDALKLARGEVVTYVQPGLSWPPDHLERLAGHFAHASIDAVAVPVNLTVMRSSQNGERAVEFTQYAGSPIGDPGGKIGEAIPLGALAHRRSLVDRLGAFEETLPLLSDVEFVQRLFERAKIGLDSSRPLTWTRKIGDLHPALADPNGYLATLQHIYRAHPAHDSVAAMRTEHLQRMHRALSSLAATGEPEQAAALWFLARGASSPPPAPAPDRRMRILVIDDRVPYAELGRGYPRAKELLLTLRDAGADVVFYPLQTPFDEAPLNGGIPGITILYGRGREYLAATLESLLPAVDIVWVSRPHNMKIFRELVDLRKERSWGLVYDAEAIFADRDIARAALQGTPLDEPLRQQMIASEVSLTAGADAISAVSPADAQTFARFSHAPVTVVSFSIPAAPTPNPWSKRQGVAFVGAIEIDSPNEDALLWFVREVSPLLAQSVPSNVLHAGVQQSPAMADRADRVEFLGIVPDLRALYDSVRVFVAPNRFAAGQPQKVLEAAANGVPCVITPLLAKQLGWTHEREALVAATPEEWALAVQRLYTDAALWEELRNNALAAVQRDVAPHVFCERVVSVVQASRESRMSARSS